MLLITILPVLVLIWLILYLLLIVHLKERFPKRPLCNSFLLFPTSTTEIIDKIKNLNQSKSTGPFSIPTKLLKTLRALLSVQLIYLFNCSFSSGVVPDKFKILRVIPIFKKGSRTDLPNYRPISLLSVFNGILEKLMYNRLVNFLDKSNIFFHGQFSFCSNRSTTHAILLITGKIQKAIENKFYFCGIFLDFSKAFDTVDHKILLKKT